MPEIYSDAMSPIIVPGDMILVNKRRPVVRGDIALFEPPNRPGGLAVRRIVGIPGDQIEITKNAVRINGQPFLERAFRRTLPKRTLTGYFVLADRLAGHEDSRHYGPVQAAAVRGTVTHVLIPSKARAKRTYIDPVTGTLPAAEPSAEPQPEAAH
jgi:signal peptidase I